MRVPLFLSELVGFARDGQPLPDTRFELLQTMVARACAEHRDALRIDGQEDAATRLLSALATHLTDRGATEMSATDACRLLRTTLIALRDAGEMMNPPPAAIALDTLKSSHLLILGGDGESISFSHQLVQEYFAAIALSALLIESGCPAAQSLLAQWSWSVPIQLAVENLCRLDRELLAGQLIAQLGATDFESACRATGIHPETWPHARTSIEPRIRELENSDDLNAHWLAARYAAATGQPEFSATVFGGLNGFPAKSSWIYAGLDHEVVWRSLGVDFVAQILLPEHESARARVLHYLCDTVADGLDLVRAIALGDSSPLLRQRAFLKLFTRRERGLLRPFIAFVRQQGGWQRRTLEIAFHCDEISREAWRRRFRQYLGGLDTPKQRGDAYCLWERLQPDHANELAQREYAWCLERDRSLLTDADAELQYYKRFYLQKASSDPEWAATHLLAELSHPDFIEFDKAPLERLGESEKVSLVENALGRVIEADRRGGDRTTVLAQLSPLTAARWILRKIIAPETLTLDSDERDAIQSAFRKVERRAQISAACDDELADPPPESLPKLLSTMRQVGRGDRLPPEADSTLAWRDRLHHWINSLAPIDPENAHIWSDVVRLIGEIGHPSDLDLVLQMLGDERRQVRTCIEARVEWVRIHQESGQPPGQRPPTPCSYESSYHSALYQYRGEEAADRIAPLIEDPKEAPFAVNWMCAHFGALSSEGDGFGAGRYRYDLIAERRHRTTEFAQRANPFLTAMKQRIEATPPPASERENDWIGACLLAVARLEGSASGMWILDQLENHFPGSPCDGLLHAMTLVGAEFPAERLLPFVRGTIDKVLHPEFHPGYDEGFRITQILAALFHSDDPRQAIALVKGDAASFFSGDNHQLLTLLDAVADIESPDVEAWFAELAEDTLRGSVSARAKRLTLERVAGRQAWDELRILARRYLVIRNVRRQHESFDLLRWLGEVAGEHPELANGLVADSTETGSVDEALGWVTLLSHLPSEDAALSALDLTERWGESELGVVSSMFPQSQDEGGGSCFSGPFANWRHNFHCSPQIVARLEAFERSDEPILRGASTRALIWFERLHLDDAHY